MPLMARMQAASNHWYSTANRVSRDARHALKSAYHNWHLGPAAQPKKKFNIVLTLTQSQGQRSRWDTGWLMRIQQATPVEYGD
jgi:hypothetical protein